MTLYSLEDFLGSMASTNPLHPKVPRPVMFQKTHLWIYLQILPTHLDRLFQSTADLASCVSPSLKRITSVQEY